MGYSGEHQQGCVDRLSGQHAVSEEYYGGLPCGNRQLTERGMFGWGQFNPDQIPLRGAVFFLDSGTVNAVQVAVEIPDLAAVRVFHGWSAGAVQFTLEVPHLTAVRQLNGGTIFAVELVIDVPHPGTVRFLDSGTTETVPQSVVVPPRGAVRLFDGRAVDAVPLSFDVPLPTTGRPFDGGPVDAVQQPVEVPLFGTLSIGPHNRGGGFLVACRDRHFAPFFVWCQAFRDCVTALTVVGVPILTSTRGTYPAESLRSSALTDQELWLLAARGCGVPCHRPGEPAAAGFGGSAWVTGPAGTPPPEQGPTGVRGAAQGRRPVGIRDACRPIPVSPVRGDLGPGRNLQHTVKTGVSVVPVDTITLTPIDSTAPDNTAPGGAQDGVRHLCGLRAEASDPTGRRHPAP
jgi:hypothetical protein